jgi:hypothetical protein
MDTTRQISKILAILCMGIVLGLSVSCQLHASPHTHGMSHVGHDDADHDQTPSSTHSDMACIVAVIPSMTRLLALSALKYDVLRLAVKPLVPALEFDIPPRTSP